MVAFLLILTLVVPLATQGGSPDRSMTPDTGGPATQLPWWKTTSRDLDRDQIEDGLEGRAGPFRGLFVVFESYPGVRPQARVAQLGLEVEFVDGGINTVLTGPATPSQVQEVSRLPGVVFVEEEQLFYPFLDVSLSAMKIRSSNEYAPVAWDEFDDGDDAGSGINIAILDTGVDDDHDFLAGSLIAGVDFTDTNPFAPRDGSADPDDNNGHGTHVSSTALGFDPNEGLYHGVAPQARLVDVKVMTDVGVGGNLLQGLNWSLEHKDDDWEDDGAANNGIQVVSISAGTSGGSDGTDAVSQKANELVANGIVVVAAMGNDGQEEVPAPAAADWVIAVANMDDGNTVDRDDDSINQDASNRGPRADDGDDQHWEELKPDVSATGTDILAAQHTLGNDGAGNSNVVSKTGTSMATPHVSGLVALLLQSEPELTPGPGSNPVMWRLRNLSQPWGEVSFPALSDRYNNWSGHGYVEGYDIVHTEAPDPVMLKAWADPREALEGDPVTLYATLENQGNVGLTSARLDFYEDNAQTGERITSRSIGALEPDEQVTLSLSWSDPGVGNHTVEALISASDPQERSLRNNNATFSVLIDEPPQIPDLRVEQIWLSDETPSDGQILTLYATLANVGQETVTSARYAFYLGDPATDGELIDDGNLDELASQESVQVEALWHAEEGQGQAVYVEVSQIEPEDADADNNLNSITVDVAGRPSEPDLTISDHDLAIVPEVPESGVTVTITITLYNIGGQTGTADVELYLDDELLHNFEAESVAASDSTTLEYQWMAESGSHELEVRIGTVDPQEADRDNNRAGLEFQVLPGGPDFSLENLDLPGRLVAGEPANLRVQVRNRGESTGNVTATFYVDGAKVAETPVRELKVGRTRTLTVSWTPVMGAKLLRVLLAGAGDLNLDNNRAEESLRVEEPFRLSLEEPYLTGRTGQPSLFTVVVENRASQAGTGNLELNAPGFPGNLTFTETQDRSLEVTLGAYESRYLTVEAQLGPQVGAGNHSFQVRAVFAAWSGRTEGALALPLVIKPLSLELIQGRSGELTALLFNPQPERLTFDLRVGELPRGVTLKVNQRKEADLVSVDGLDLREAGLEVSLAPNARVGEHEVTLTLTSTDQHYSYQGSFQLTVVKQKQDNPGLLPGFELGLTVLALVAALATVTSKPRP